MSINEQPRAPMHPNKLRAGQCSHWKGRHPMNRSVRRPLTTAAVAIALVAFGTIAISTARSAGPPTSCAAVRAAAPGAPDGTYAILTGGRFLGVYCFDMAGTPREYLSLVNTGATFNFGQYTAGGASPGTS